VVVLQYDDSPSRDLPKHKASKKGLNDELKDIIDRNWHWHCVTCAPYSYTQSTSGATAAKWHTRPPHSSAPAAFTSRPPSLDLK